MCTPGRLWLAVGVESNACALPPLCVHAGAGARPGPKPSPLMVVAFVTTHVVAVLALALHH